MKEILAVVYLIGYVVLSCILVVPAVILWIIDLLFDKEVRTLNLFRFWWGRLYFNLSPGWHIKSEGMENIDKKKSYIIVMNHQSALDIPFSTFIRTQFNWVSKFEVLYVPIVGWLIWMCRDITIKRGDTKSTRHMVQAIASKIKNGKSVLLYPEGTRSRDGRIKRFKEGAFAMAKANKVGILPVVIDGTFDAMPRGSFGYKLHQNFKLKVLPEVPYDSFKDQQPKDIAAHLEELMRTEHRKMAPQKYSE